MSTMLRRFKSLKLTTRILIIFLAAWALLLTSDVFGRFFASFQVQPQTMSDSKTSEIDVAGNTPTVLEHFTSVEIRIPIEFRWRSDETSHCTVNKNDNNVTMFVHSKKLVIEEKNKSWLKTHKNDLIFDCTSPTINDITVNGSGDIMLSNLNGDALSAIVNGAGEIKASGNLNKFYGQVNGAGDLELENLSINYAEVEINGAGEISIPGAQKAKMSINGVGEIQISRNTEILHKNINGIGEIEVID